jgi:hypothetical protein
MDEATRQACMADVQAACDRAAAQWSGDPDTLDQALQTMQGEIGICIGYHLPQSTGWEFTLEMRAHDRTLVIETSHRGYAIVDERFE